MGYREGSQKVPVGQFARLVLLFLALVASGFSRAADNGEFLRQLRLNDFKSLEAGTRSLQRQFESGRVSETDLRDAYRQFYDLNGADLRKLDRWQDAFPKSYAVHLVRGTFYARRGAAARGTKWASETPPENFLGMRLDNEQALAEFTASLPLTQKPFLSVFQMMTLEGVNRPPRKELMEFGTRMLPTNRLIRGRYILFLTPRWGGSYEEMRAFIDYARRTGATPKGILELQSLMFDDMGDTAFLRGDKAAADRYFHKALQLHEAVGGAAMGPLPFATCYNREVTKPRELCHKTGR
ncbi:DUF4034 domain-containing protein [Lysobacter sp. TY2-98]|uniref:DUF4034 domain-containing protein n=1 Tax=Lysobacter sp. TY2-98 TaxID=2290922 RepID=UPI0013B413D1|nr:DUF4034 domain-containing protein [Lysobacter sp. TY2-98]